MSGDESVGDSLPTSSPDGTYTFAGPSDVDVEGHRCAEDRNFEFPIGRKSSCRRADFVVNYRNHTGKKPYACDMCKKKCATLDFNLRYNNGKHSDLISVGSLLNPLQPSDFADGSTSSSEKI
ncbi:hypothetical protein AVEN_233072-1 [Araneus ventricosus]|uniref:C2H2-type domain-containing protein n=1 Tax=Araneus ventricosus TaxID=182803 RepID=A0A4Y2PAF0_ARAVE|nr:hypothetical protein AVEN_233072-1 [Araneus ventricosus]